MDPENNKPYTRYKSSRVRSFNKPLKRQPEGQPAGSPPPRRTRDAAGGSPRRRPRWGRIILLSLVALLLLALATAAFFYWRFDRAVRASNAKVPADVERVLKPALGGPLATPVNILFLGSDQRPDEPARADTIMLMRFDGRGKIISQLSIPRDTLVDIPGYGEGKINSAYAYGGPALQIETVSQLTGLPIHHYVELDFSGFPAIVDSLGGVEIEVPKAIDSLYPNGLDWTEVHFSPGLQHMDGDRALVYVRVRYSDDDFQRMGRQQQFMEALQKRINSRAGMMKMPWVAPELIGNMTTDLSSSELMALAWIKVRTPAANNRKFVMAGESTDIGGGSYVVLDESANQKQLKDFLAGN